MPIPLNFAVKDILAYSHTNTELDTLILNNSFITLQIKTHKSLSKLV